jgi:phage tail sheath protein FI
VPVTPTYPGVYIEELPSGVRTITGVATSIAAFVDSFKKGPVNEAVQCLSFADFEREFGGLDSGSEASYAIQQFFLNGGGEAWVVRVAREEPDPNAAVAADVEIGATVGAGAAALTVEAVSPGVWGNSLRAGIEPPNAAGVFNLVVSQFDTEGDRPVLRQQDVHRNLVMDGTSNTFADTVVNDAETGSKLVRVEATGTNPPLANGTLSGAIGATEVALPETASIQVAIDPAPDSAVSETAKVTFPGGPGSVNRKLLDIATALEAAIRSAKPENTAFAGATVNVTGDRIWALPGRGKPNAKITFDIVAGDQTATALRLTTGSAVRMATLSGTHAAPPAIPATPQVRVTIGAANFNVPLTFPAAITIPGPAPLADVATSLQAAIRGADPSPAFTQATVTVLGDQLLVLSGDPALAATFAQVGGNTTATVLLLTSANATTRPAILSGAHAASPTLPAAPKVGVTAGATTKVATLTFGAGVALPGAVAPADIAPVLQTAIRAADPAAAFAQATVGLVGNRLVALSGDAAQAITIANATPDDTTATILKLTTDATINIAEYQLGGGTVAVSAQVDGAVGDDGDPPDGTALIGKESTKSGIFALEDVDLFNLLMIPRTALVGTTNGLTETEAGTVMTVAIQYCERRRAIFLMDTPFGFDEPTEIKSWLSANDTLRNKNAALYYPRVKISDPLDKFRLRSVGASGTVAGVYARTDNNRGVWKAPAGTDASLINVTALDDLLTDSENGTLNPLAINCLRTFPVFGSVVWGARTLKGADQEASEWKYVPVRRMALFLEESLYRGTKWVVFEPNDEPLWAQIRLNIGAFMQNLFRQGAFQGSSPREAYFVKCDKETTTQTDINLGIVNIIVGFAPLKPAEFVIIKFQQMAGQIAT